VAFLTPDAFAPRMFTAGMARVATQLSAVLGNPLTVPHRTGRRLLLQGVLSQPSNLNLDAWKQSAGVFPRRLNIVLRSSGCDTLQHARETFKTSIELIDPPKNRYNPPTLVVERSKFSTLVQAPRFICGVNLKSQISNLNRLTGFHKVHP